jgi:hypothetical protein
LPYSHKVYDPYAALIIRDTINGISGIAFDPIIPNMIKQLARYIKYENLKLPSVDLKFVDTYPTYRNYTTTDVDKIKIIRALSKALLPEDIHTSGENVI